MSLSCKSTSLLNSPSRILFYQLALKEFHNYGVLEMDPPVPIQELLEVACEDDVIPESAAGSKEDLVVEIMDVLAEHAPMLQEYFNLKIDDDGNLLTLPLLLAGHSPLMGKLPLFLMRLGTEVSFRVSRHDMRVTPTSRSIGPRKSPVSRIFARSSRVSLPRKRVPSKDPMNGTATKIWFTKWYSRR